MNKNNIYIPSSKKGFMPVLLLLSGIICLFAGTFIMLLLWVFLYFSDFESYGIESLLLTFLLLFSFLMIVLIPGIIAISRYATVFYKDDEGNTIGYRLKLKYIRNSDKKIKNTISERIVQLVIGILLGGFVWLTPMLTIIRYVLKIIKCNTDKDFVLSNLNDENIYAAKLTYKKEANYQLNTVYKNINETHNSSPIRIGTKLFVFTALVTTIFITLHIAIVSVVGNHDTKTKKAANEIKVALEENLSEFGYENTSTKPMKFVREAHYSDSSIVLMYNSKGELREVEVDVYWDIEENPDKILNEISAIYDSLGIELDENVYRENIIGLQTKTKSGYIEKYDDYSVYLSLSSGHINLIVR